MTSSTYSGDFLVRAATPSDDEAILALCHRFTETHLPAHRQKQRYLQHLRSDLQRDLDDIPRGSAIFVAEHINGAFAGFARLRLVNDSIDGKRNAHLADLAVAYHFEGQGVAQALMLAAEDFAKEYGCEHLQLFVFPNNARALHFYERQGFSTDMLRLVKPLR